MAAAASSNRWTCGLCDGFKSTSKSGSVSSLILILTVTNCVACSGHYNMFIISLYYQHSKDLSGFYWCLSVEGWWTCWWALGQQWAFWSLINPWFFIGILSDSMIAIWVVSLSNVLNVSREQGTKKIFSLVVHIPNKVSLTSTYTHGHRKYGAHRPPWSIEGRAGAHTYNQIKVTIQFAVLPGAEFTGYQSGLIWGTLLASYCCFYHLFLVLLFLPFVCYCFCLYCVSQGLYIALHTKGALQIHLPGIWHIGLEGEKKYTFGHPDHQEQFNMWTKGSENQNVIIVIWGWPTQPAQDSQGVKYQHMSYRCRGYPLESAWGAAGLVLSKK